MRVGHSWEEGRSFGCEDLFFQAIEFLALVMPCCKSGATSLSFPNTVKTKQHQNRELAKVYALWPLLRLRCVAVWCWWCGVVFLCLWPLSSHSKPRARHSEPLKATPAPLRATQCLKSSEKPQKATSSHFEPLKRHVRVFQFQVRG